ncbi:hypothetical protein F8388_003050 [Cannabis sativa]|uniref:Uncharacterized protein n=1 Tax=Cannabis sativa TaxID=3483 RepID=A0A7J6HE25_CANSA|nr:hypothetical protein F8388_003050 [Cannabis sativa]
MIIGLWCATKDFDKPLPLQIPTIYNLADHSLKLHKTCSTFGPVRLVAATMAVDSVDGGDGDGRSET